MWQISIVFLICLFAGPTYSNPPSPAPPESKQQEQAKTGERNQRASKEERGSHTSPLIVEVLPPKGADETAKQQHEYEYAKSFYDRLIAWATVALAIVTIGLAVFTALLWLATYRLAQDAKQTATRQAGEMQETLRIARESAKASRDAADIAHAAMVAGERAFVFATGLAQFFAPIPGTSQYIWRFRPNWQNSGDTPTKNMTMHVECELRETQLPDGFKFNYVTEDIAPALIPPKTTTHGGQVPRAPKPAITPQDILEIQAGKKYFYVWGWARYWDVFPGTSPHITRFCWMIDPVGDPTTFRPGSQVVGETLTFNTLHHHEGNCADDECLE